MAEESEDIALYRRIGEPEVGVGDDVCRGGERGRGGEHPRILSMADVLYKPCGAGHPSRLPCSRLSFPRMLPLPLLPAQEIEFRVRYAETDQMGVVYHTNYLVWCEMGRTSFIRGRGMSYAEVERRGVGLAVSEVTARFHSAARYDDLIRVRTSLTAVRSRAITFDYLVSNAESGERLVTAQTVLVSIGREGRLVSLPAEIRALFRPEA